MVLIRFTDPESKRRAIETVVGEFPFRSWSSGEMLLPEEALARLAREDIPFSFEGSAAYDKLQEAERLRDWLSAYLEEKAELNTEFVQSIERGKADIEAGRVLVREAR